jgi:putative redox protein
MALMAIAWIQHQGVSMSEVAVAWVQDNQFVATGSGGHSVVVDAPGGRQTWTGMKPTELLLAAVASCTGVDVISILHKARQQVTSLRVTATGVQREELPRAFTQIAVHYEIQGHDIQANVVERAIALSEEKYCSVAATVRGVATITTSYTIQAVETVDPGTSA